MYMKGYEEELLEWRRMLDEALRREDGWLALAGLHWLHPGKNTFGSGEGNDIVLPAEEGVPQRAGSFELNENAVILHVEQPGTVKVGEKEAQNLELRTDRAAETDYIYLGPLKLVVIERGDRLAIRVWNSKSREVLNFQGREWYPPDEEYRVQARYTPFTSGGFLDLPDVAGSVQRIPVLGSLDFNLQGKNCRLVALPAGDRDLFIIFRDETSGEDTYPAGRYLVAPEPENGTVILDFNRAYNPPCAFTPYATCPLPPRENHLPLRIEAGERFHPV
jgi:uncharacterized protein (DUF1684 family)